MNEFDHKFIEWLELWVKVKNRNAFEEQLYKEVGTNHVLFGIIVRAIAKREDSDDVLFLLVENNTFVEVHLTWCSTPSLQANWPSTTIYSTFAEWQDKRMTESDDNNESNC